MGGSATIYYAKINLNSSHIFDIYDERIEMTSIMQKLFDSISKGIENTRIDVMNDIETYRATYKFEEIEKDENLCIYGSLIKISNIYVNQRDNNNKPIKVAVKNEETIKFYLDLNKEALAFHTTQRFGYSEFIEAMQRLLNTSINGKYGSEDEYYNFKVCLKRSNLKMDSIKEELRNITSIKSIKIDLIPPNPDDHILEEIRRNGEEKLNYLKGGNVTYKSTFLKSESSSGIILDSDIVKDELEEAVNIHSKISEEECLGNGYVQIEATSNEGYTLSLIHI